MNSNPFALNPSGTSTIAFRMLGLVIALCMAIRPEVSAAAERPNVLLILVDDLKPVLGCYGDPVAKTPHLDRLAQRGLRFDLAYCNQAVCAPSRFTLMLGAHSTSTGLYGLGSQLRATWPDAVTLPQHFASHGYRTESLGKVFHIGHGNHGDPDSFQVAHFSDKVIEYADPASTDGGQLTREEAYFANQKLGMIGSLPRGAVMESPDVADEAYADGRVAAETVRRLQAAAQRRTSEGVPFFIAAGFARPHLPFSVPRHYWDLYDPESLPLSDWEIPPIDAPQVALKTNGELANYAPVPGSGVVTGDLRRQLIHGYYASVSYVDAQIGKVLAELDRLKLTENTIVVLWGDHGFHLGDHGLWTKHTNYEQANRIPLIITAPGITQPGSVTQQFAESVDLFPTLAELTGLPAPRGPQPIDGISLFSVLRDPTARVRDHAYHVFPKAKLGRAIRTERYRLVEWKNVGDTPESAEIELYDYQLDPLEQRNHAAEQPEIVKQLRATLAKYPEPVDPRAQPKSRPASNGPSSALHRPNMVFFLTDDQGQLDSSPYGDKQLQTPNMQRLANRGLTFTRAYVASPSCAPSRAALLTGLMPARNGAEANHSKPRADIRKWPSYFQELGYEVVAFGKVSHYKHTEDYGFDRFAHDTFHDHASIPAAVEYLKNRPASEKRPLCLFVGSNWPHVPWPERELGYDPQALSLPAGSIDTPVTRAWRARYAAAVTEADRDLGRILDAVEQFLPADTLMTFTSDHGAQWPFGKWNLYESGIAVPLMISWPNVVPPGTTTQALVNWTDLLPTFIEVAGGKAPGNIDGLSFLPVLRHQAQSHRQHIFATHSNDNRMNVYPSRSVRNDRWKYIRNLHPEYAFTTHIDLVAGALGQRAFFSTWEAAAQSDPYAANILKRYHTRPAEELYDLEADPHEQRNLASDPQYTQHLMELRIQLDAWLLSQGDQQRIQVEPRLLSNPRSYGPQAEINDQPPRNPKKPLSQ